MKSTVTKARIPKDVNTIEITMTNRLLITSNRPGLGTGGTVLGSVAVMVADASSDSITTPNQDPSASPRLCASLNLDLPSDAHGNLRFPQGFRIARPGVVRKIVLA
ncbi:MAG: hypothetical protein JW719_10190, partial [Pirellulales bacterium]|nr:hypothetical protein [Pirellulales bacterium]